MGYATGVFKKLAIKRQAALGVKAPAGAAGSSRYMRRVTSTLDLVKATYGSAEINPSQQRRDFRHGVRSVPGSISGELSVGGYQLPMESVLRRGATAGVTAGVAADLVVASSGAGTKAGTLTRAGASFLTTGFKVGDVVRILNNAQAANNAKNLLITGLTQTVMTVRTLDGTDLVAAGAGAGTISVVGFKTFTPEDGQTRDYYTIEHWFSDVPTSEQFTDVVFTGMTVGLPSTGMATIEFPLLGLDMQTSPGQYFTDPSPAPTGPIEAAVNGVLLVNGIVVADVTGLTITVAGNHAAPGGVVGSNVDPDIFPGVLEVSGQITALFRDASLRDLYVNETEFGIVAVFTGDNTASAPFTSFVMSRVKAGGNTKDDVATGITQTIPFTALENINGGAGTANEKTTLSIQDSAFV